MSELLSRSSSPTYSTPYFSINSLSLTISYASIFIPKPWANLITCFPILPAPITPIVLPIKSIPVNPSLENIPFDVLSIIGLNFLANASINANVYSATVLLPYPGTLQTVIPFLLACSTSM